MHHLDFNEIHEGNNLIGHFQAVAVSVLQYGYTTWTLMKHMKETMISEFKAEALSVLLNGCTSWTFIKCMDKKLYGDLTRMLCFKQTLEAAPHKTSAIWQLTSYLKNHASKTNRTCCAQPEKSESAYKRPSLMDSYAWTHECWPAGKNIY